MSKTEFIIDEELANKICYILVGKGENRLANKLCSRPVPTPSSNLDINEIVGNIEQNAFVPDFQTQIDEPCVKISDVLSVLETYLNPPK